MDPWAPLNQPGDTRTEATAGPIPGFPKPSALAGFFSRTMARVMDFFYIIFLSVLVTFLVLLTIEVAVAVGAAPAHWIGAVERSVPAVWPMSWITLILYHTLCEAFSGATLGKWICGIRVLSQTGEPVSLERSFVRSGALFADGFWMGIIGYQAMSVTRRRQRHGDKLGKTVVVRSGAVPEASQRPVLMVLGVLLAATLTHMMLVGGTLLLAVVAS